MKENNDLLDKRLREAFNEFVLDTPSSGFVENLMVRVEREAAKAQRQRVWMTCGQIAAGICAMILLPALAIYLCRIYVPGFTFVFTFPKIDLNLDPNLIAIGLTVLLLLMADTLLRKHARSKETE
ncbi:hypothetical protein AGMMS49965_10570 [Bacteroidia bacterium]|nr:hypothetical protein AGMMS49965_10570 [Bacteroidia bacterium]